MKQIRFDADTRCRGREGVASAAKASQDANNCFFAAALFTGANAEPFQYKEVITAPAEPTPVPWLD